MFRITLSCSVILRLANCIGSATTPPPKEGMLDDVVFNGKEYLGEVLVQYNPYSLGKLHKERLRGEMLPRCWQVQVNIDLMGNSVFEGARAISRVSGCDIKIATELMNNLPGVIPKPMYKHPCERV
ncbi:MAG: hypothetical protein PUP93_09830 [Rhizonema sp. NSF051]|nr:hypothetical protein [Rhizonema sp. NSF051]